MSSSESMPVESNEGEKRANLVQVLAESEHAKASSEEEAETFGPPLPEEYASAEKSLNELLDAVESDKKAELSMKVIKPLAAILAFAPMAMGSIMTAIAKSGGEKIGDEQRLSFLENIRNEMNEHFVKPLKFAGKSKAAEYLNQVEQQAEKLKAARGELNPQALE